MEEGLLNASRIRHNLGWEELVLIERRGEAYRLNRQINWYANQAFQDMYYANQIKMNITKEQKDISNLEKDAEEEAELADADTSEASMWALRGYGDGRAYVASYMSGMELAKEANEEQERADALLEHANQTKEEGTQRLNEAQAALAEAEEAKNHTSIDKGICKWFAWSCHSVEDNNSDSSSSSNKKHNSTSTVITNPTDAAIQANKDIQDALQEIQNADAEHDLAMELLVNASSLANLSTQILADSEMFHEAAKFDKKEADKYRTEAAEDEEYYKDDEKIIKEETAEITVEERSMYNYTNSSRRNVELALSRHQDFEHVVQEYNLEVARLKTTQILLNETIDDAKHHVARAGWSALAACVSGICLLSLIVVQIIATFRYQRPLMWLVRGPPHTIYDALYLTSHFCIFLLALGYVGELLMEFDKQTNLTRLGITLTFSVVGSMIQVVLLHLLPHVWLINQNNNSNGRMFGIGILSDSSWLKIFSREVAS